MFYDYDAIIIGGGHNGLICSGYLTGAGLRVLVLEKNSNVGGAIITQELFPHCFFSTYAFYCYLLHQKIIDDFKLRQFGFEIYPFDILRFQPFLDGNKLLIYKTLEETQESIKIFSKEDARSYKNWGEFWYQAAEILYPYFLTQPPTLEEIAKKLKTKSSKIVFEKLLKSNMRELVFEHFKHPSIRAAFIHAQDVGTSTVKGGLLCNAYMRCSAFSHPENVGMIKGGAGQLSNALAAAISSMGVKILTNAEVTNIVVEEGRAQGIVLKDNTRINSRIIVSNLDPKRTFLNLLSEENISSGFRKSIKNLKTNVGYLKFHAVLNKLPDASKYFEKNFNPRHLAYIKICPTVEYYEEAWKAACNNDFPSKPVLDINIPTLYDVSIAPSGKHLLSAWASYFPFYLSKGSWETRRNEAINIILNVLECYFPNIRECINNCLVLSPVDMETNIGLTNGNIRHIDMVPEQFLSQRPLMGYSNYKTPIENLYLCGAGTHPGGEITGAPGHNAAKKILQDFKVEE
ncbi:MAG: FAD-dependent oxidoreductase [Burkholderiales bacterium]|jgi:phytoene dehydrogenase-like protein|nr:FAD-dependent oxidoreductase [Burkholderiales bacterium]